MILILILQSLFALSFLILRKIGIYGAPFFTVGVRLIFAGAALLIVQFIQNKNEFYKVKEQWKIFFLASLLKTYIANAFGQYGIQYLPCCIVSFIYNLAPFITAAFSYLFFKEKINSKKMLTLIVGLFGFLPVFLSNPITYASCYQPLFTCLPYIAVILSTVSSAYGWITIKELVYEKKVGIILVNGVTLFLGGLFSILNSIIIRENITFLYKLDFWKYVILASIIMHVFCYNLYSRLLTKFSPTFMSFSGFITTFLTALLALFFLGETIQASLIISGFIVIPSLIVYYRLEK